MKRRYRRLGLFAGLAVTTVFVMYVMRALHGRDLSGYATPRAFTGIVIAASLWTFSVPLIALAWRDLLAGLGTVKSWRELTAILGITQLAKYVPGNVVQYLGRIGMSLSRGIPAPDLASTIVLETLLLIAAAIVVGIGAGALSSVGLDVVKQHRSQLVVIAVLVLLALYGLLIFRRVGPKLIQKFAPQYAPSMERAVLPPQPNLIRSFALYCCVYVVLGSTLIVLAHFALHTETRDYWLLVAAFALAWVVGFATPGAPAGLGVREGLLLLMLAPVYSTASATILIVALRITTTVGDLLMFLLGAILLPRCPRKLSTPP